MVKGKKVGGRSRSSTFMALRKQRNIAAESRCIMQHNKLVQGIPVEDQTLIREQGTNVVDRLKMMCEVEAELHPFVSAKLDP